MYNGDFLRTTTYIEHDFCSGKKKYIYILEEEISLTHFHVWQR